MIRSLLNAIRQAATMRGGVVIATMAALAAVAGCSRPRPDRTTPMGPCVAPLEPYVRTSLYVDRSNRNDPSGRLTDEEWQRFVDTVLLRYFPAGGSMIANAGWWRRPDGSTGGGPGRTLVVLAPLADTLPHREAVQAVIAEYKRRYGVRSVLWEESRSCAAF
jgi:hypothetical protein